MGDITAEQTAAEKFANSARYATEKSEADINKMFSYHPPKEDQIPRYTAINDLCAALAHLVDVSCPGSREKSLALTAIQQARMWANAAIAIHE